MQNVKLIIGANYGDEGKGLATDFFGAQAAGSFGTINVLTNGGPQRGHTVELADGRRHVFKHFGAASFRGAASYFAEQFIVNPGNIYESPLPLLHSLGYVDKSAVFRKERSPQQLRIRDLGDCTAISERIRNFLRNLCGNEQ